MTSAFFSRLTSICGVGDKSQVLGYSRKILPSYIPMSGYARTLALQKFAKNLQSKFGKCLINCSYSQGRNVK